MRRSWLEISIKQIISNYNIYKSFLSTEQEIMAVVKADAYGHGEEKIAECLQQIGCKHFAVSNLEEAILLRKAGIHGQILILGYTPISSIQDLLKYDITQALLSEEYAELLSGKGIKAQFAIDTGMNRVGLNADCCKECERIIRKYSTEFQLNGLFTHLCVADAPNEQEFTEAQIRKFKAVVDSVADCKLAYIHCMNSAGGLWSASYGNLVRLGIILYGLKPDCSNVLPAGIKSCLTWKSVVSMIKKVYPGETIGYGRTYRVKKEMTIATVPTGYADGYNRSLSNKGHVLISGMEAPIVGRVCMDQMMVDVTNIPNVQFEDEVILIGEGYNADDMARDVGTIGYEIICNISKRVSRIYK